VVQLECAECKQSFSVPPSAAKGGRKYCSDSCHRKAKAGKVTMSCRWCSVRFVAYQVQAQRGRAFCSQECYLLFRRSQLPSPLRSTVTITCMNCNAAFEAEPSAHRKYCSVACYKAARSSEKITMQCEYCNEPYQVYQSVIDRHRTKGSQVRFCSKGCYSAARAERRVERSCSQCGATFMVDMAQLDYEARTGKRRAVYCSRKCQGRSHSSRRRDRITVFCATCGAALERTQYKIKTQNLHFCSYTCMAHEVPNWSVSPGFKGGMRTDLGHFVRSSWEANIARFFRFMHKPYAYESKTFRLSSSSYRPDFFVDGYWVEVKGQMRADAAAKIEEFRRLYPDEVLVVIDATRYRQIAKEFADRIPGWEYQDIPAWQRGGDRRRKDVRGRLNLPKRVISAQSTASK
jgi:hypothetical protein